MKGSNVQSGQLLTSFVTTVNKMTKQGSSSVKPTQQIPEHDSEHSSKNLETINVAPKVTARSEMDEDDLHRSDEIIDLDQVSARGNSQQSQRQRHQKRNELDSSDDEGLT